MLKSFPTFVDCLSIAENATWAPGNLYFVVSHGASKYFLHVFDFCLINAGDDDFKHLSQNAEDHVPAFDELGTCKPLYSLSMDLFLNLKSLS